MHICLNNVIQYCKVNNKPLTYLPEDTNNLQPITPSLLINGFEFKNFHTQSTLKILATHPLMRKPFSLNVYLAINLYLKLMKMLAFVLTSSLCERSQSAM
jgi:hypothetical protein